MKRDPFFTYIKALGNAHLVLKKTMVAYEFSHYSENDSCKVTFIIHMFIDKHHFPTRTSSYTLHTAEVYADGDQYIYTKTYSKLILATVCGLHFIQTCC